MKINTKLITNKSKLVILWILKIYKHDCVMIVLAGYNNSLSARRSVSRLEVWTIIITTDTNSTCLVAESSNDLPILSMFAPIASFPRAAAISLISATCPGWIRCSDTIDVVLVKLLHRAPRVIRPIH